MEKLVIFGILGFAFAAIFGFARAIGEAMVEHLDWKTRDAAYRASRA